MSTAVITTSTARRNSVPALSELLDALDDSFGCEFHVIDVQSRASVYQAESLPPCDAACPAELLGAATRGGQPQFIVDEDAVVVLALPLVQALNMPWVAYAPFATRNVGDEQLGRIERLLDFNAAEARAWINVQPQWPAAALERLGRELLRRLQAQRRNLQLEDELDKVSCSLSVSYEEISLLHSISQNFRLSRSDEELGSLALEWLSDCVPAEGVALVYLPLAKANDTTYHTRTQLQLLTHGNCPPQAAEEVLQLVEELGGARSGRPIVRNARRAQGPLPDGVRQLVVAPLVEGERVFGYLIAFNHNQQQEFGTVEANLLASVAAMLGVHCRNRDLYRQQDEFLASVVRALTSAIDAKDPYTCGHSDRVARVATRIASQLGCDSNFLATIYMAGLLHDIGKIGIDDAVLRKPGRLSDAEFEHIKQHPALGYKILADIKQFASVLPAVLHHHEQWDGKGYPCELAGDQIPYIARIVAVADAYDAMSSDRPYRPGMPEEKVCKIFREGAGYQWDAEVVAAFFACYDDIRAISKDERARLSLDVQQWLI